ncbi:MAG TPA: glycosyltransferase family 9 protein, partial [Actinomycetota bacterium]|nr:glycosyltransferase family 9 protein [Actinomycetota bacterium]
MSPHVLVARQDSVGDVLLAGPAVRAVAAGAGRVTLLCGPRGRAAAELLPGVDQVVVEHAAWIDAQPERITRKAMDSLVDRLTDLEVDQAAILTSFHQSPLPLALLLRMAGVPIIAAVSVDYPGSLLDVRHRVDDDLHEVVRGLSLVATLGYRLPEGDEGGLRIRRDRAAGVPDLGGGGYVVVHPGASVPARTWAPQRHAALVDALAGAGRRVVVTGGPGERALTALVAGPRRAPDRVVDLGGRLDLAGLAEVLGRAGVVVVGNTGPAHLAAAVGTPVVS